MPISSKSPSYRKTFVAHVIIGALTCDAVVLAVQIALFHVGSDVRYLAALAFVSFASSPLCPKTIGFYFNCSVSCAYDKCVDVFK